MHRNTKRWLIAFAVAAPIAGLLSIIAISLGDWLPRQVWFANLILR